MRQKLGATRITKQRQCILEELQKLKTHPTAEELYYIIKEKIPNISIGTVYRNLETLFQSGYILKLEEFGKQKRFDANTHPHLHIYCIKCGKVRDVEQGFKIDDSYKNLSSDFKIMGYDFNLYGICNECMSLEE